MVIERFKSYEDAKDFVKYMENNYKAKNISISKPENNFSVYGNERPWYVFLKLSVKNSKNYNEDLGRHVL